MGHLFDLPKEAAGQGIQALGSVGDGSHPFGNDPLLTAQGNKYRVTQLNFPDGLLEPDRKGVERYQHVVIHRLCSEDGGSDALERYRSG